MARVMVLGGGFGGIAAAVALREQLATEDEVVLVDRRDDFVMGLRKTWHLLGMSPLAYGTRHLAQLEQRGIRVVRGEISALDPASLTAKVGGEDLTADALVLALGAAHDMAAVPAWPTTVSMSGHATAWSMPTRRSKPSAAVARWSASSACRTAVRQPHTSSRFCWPTGWMSAASTRRSASSRPRQSASQVSARRGARHLMAAWPSGGSGSCQAIRQRR